MCKRAQPVTRTQSLGEGDGCRLLAACRRYAKVELIYSRIRSEVNDRGVVNVKGCPFTLSENYARPTLYEDTPDLYSGAQWHFSITGTKDFDLSRAKPNWHSGHSFDPRTWSVLLAHEYANIFWSVSGRPLASVDEKRLRPGFALDRAIRDH